MNMDFKRYFLGLIEIVKILFTDFKEFEWSD